MKVHQNSVFANFVPCKSAFSNILVFLIREHSNNKMVPISVHYFSSSKCMPIFILVGKMVLLVCIKSALIISFLARTINKTSLNFYQNLGSVICKKMLEQCIKMQYTCLTLPSASGLPLRES